MSPLSLRLRQAGVDPASHADTCMQAETVSRCIDAHGDADTCKQTLKRVIRLLCSFHFNSLPSTFSYSFSWIELGVRGQCPSCDKWGTLQNGICLRAPTLHQPQPDSQRKRLRYSDLKLCIRRNPCLNPCSNASRGARIDRQGAGDTWVAPIFVGLKCKPHWCAVQWGVASGSLLAIDPATPISRSCAIL